MNKQMIEEIAKVKIGAILEKVNMGDGYADINSLADEIYHILIPEGVVVLTKEEYDGLKCDAERYDPFWFCTFGGCEGVCNDCKDTCEMSIFVKTRKETVEKFLEMAKVKARPVYVNVDDNPRKNSFLLLSDIDEICKEISEGKK